MRNISTALSVCVLSSSSSAHNIIRGARLKKPGRPRGFRFIIIIIQNVSRVFFRNLYTHITHNKYFFKWKNIGEIYKQDRCDDNIVWKKVRARWWSGDTRGIRDISTREAIFNTRWRGFYYYYFQDSFLLHFTTSDNDDEERGFVVVSGRIHTHTTPYRAPHCTHCARTGRRTVGNPGAKSSPSVVLRHRHRPKQPHTHTSSLYYLLLFSLSLTHSYTH